MLKNIKSVKNYDDHLKNAISAFSRCLDQIGVIKDFRYEFPNAQQADTADCTARFSFGPTHYVILLEVFSKGEIREAKLAVERFEHYMKNTPQAYGVMVAPYINENAVGHCRSHGIGTVDMAGNCCLAWENLHLEIKGNRNPFPKRDAIKSVYQPRASRVVRVLLSEPRRAWKMQELANEALVSLALVFQVKRRLESREWIATGRGKLQLIHPEELLAEWVENYGHEKDEIHGFYSMRSLDELKGSLQEARERRHLKFALSGFSGASIYYPFVNYPSEMLYSTDIEMTAAALGLKKVDSGANFYVIRPYEGSVFYGSRVVDGISVASPLQVYLDLRASKGRGKEAAEAILEKVLKPLW